jgi:serine kinase of HPr protein (carbohydrate metabolism regulator)
MKLHDIFKQLELNVKSGADLLEREVTGGYVSDILSDVLAHATSGDIWVTIQIHLNIIPIASMKEIAGIIIANGRQPDEETLKKAETENVPVLGTDMSAFQIVGKLYQLGIRAQDENV